MLNVLAIKELIQDSDGSKSVTLTDEGEAKARDLIKSYFGKEV